MKNVIVIDFVSSLSASEQSSNDPPGKLDAGSKKEEK